MPWRSASSTIASFVSRGYTAPVGLFGSISTSARVRSVIRLAMCADVRLPAVVGIGAVEDRSGAHLRDDRRIERIGRHRHQHFVARIDQGVERQLDALRRARGEQHAIGIDREAARTEVVGDGLPRLGNPRRRRVAVLAQTHGPADRVDEVRRRHEAGRDRIADVQVADGTPGRFDLPRFGHDVADGVGEAVDPTGDRNRRRGGGRGRHLEILLSSPVTDSRTHSTAPVRQAFASYFRARSLVEARPVAVSHNRDPEMVWLANPSVPASS